jgi:hypothetical protein
MDGARPAGGPILPIDHALLVAGIAVAQASAPTAVLAARMARRQEEPDRAGALDTLVTVFAGENAAASTRLVGSFHPQVARTGKVKNALTFAF